MGAGAVKGSMHSTVNARNQPGNTASTSSQKHPRKVSSREMSCESCSIEFTLFKRKRTCSDCNHFFCSACVWKYAVGTSTRRRCANCRMLASGNFSRTDLNAMRTRDLRQFLIRHSVPHHNCTEKSDLVDAILEYSNNIHFRREQEDIQRRLIDLQERQRQNSGLGENRSTEIELDSVSSSEPSPAVPHRDLPNETHPERDLDPASTSQSPSHSQSPMQPSSRPPSSPWQSDMAASHPLAPERNDTPPQQPENPPPAYADVAASYRESERNSTPQGSAEEATQPKPRISLEHLKKIEDIDDLSVRQLKEILVTNFVDYKGCCEKWELLNLVRRLWRSNEDNSKRAEEIFSAEESAHGEDDSATEMQPTQTSKEQDDICKICMDAMTDCVLLECGHVVTCTQCGKRLAECPICRQYISRVVRIFKS